MIALLFHCLFLPSLKKSFTLRLHFSINTTPFYLIPFFPMFSPDAAHKVQLKHLLCGVSCLGVFEHFFQGPLSLNELKSNTLRWIHIFIHLKFLKMYAFFLFCFCFYLGVWTACSTAGPIQR